MRSAIPDRGFRPLLAGLIGTAACAVRAGMAEHVLVSRMERARAVVVGPSDDPKRAIQSTHLDADGSQIEAPCIPLNGTRTPSIDELLGTREHLVQTNGNSVFEHAVKALGSAREAAMVANDLRPEQVDWLIPHQANPRTIEAVLQRAGISRERCSINIERTANTSSASLPIALDQAVRTGNIRPHQTLLFCALEGGFAWGSEALRW